MSKKKRKLSTYDVYYLLLLEASIVIQLLPYLKSPTTL